MISWNACEGLEDDEGTCALSSGSVSLQWRDLLLTFLFILSSYLYPGPDCSITDIEMWIPPAVDFPASNDVLNTVVGVIVKVLHCRLFLCQRE